MPLDTISSSPLKYFSIMDRSLDDAIWLVVTVMPFHDSRIQSIPVLDLYDLKRLLICPTLSCS